MYCNWKWNVMQFRRYFMLMFANVIYFIVWLYIFFKIKEIKTSADYDSWLSLFPVSPLALISHGFALVLFSIGIFSPYSIQAPQVKRCCLFIGVSAIFSCAVLTCLVIALPDTIVDDYAILAFSGCFGLLIFHQLGYTQILSHFMFITLVVLWCIYSIAQVLYSCIA